MSDIGDIRSIIAKIDLNSDGKITNDELEKSAGKLPSLWLDKIKQMSKGEDIAAEKIISGWTVETNPENQPVTVFNDKRPGYVDNDDGAVYLQSVLTKEEYKTNYTDKGMYDISLSMDKPLDGKLDFSQSDWLLRESTFGIQTFANTPKEHLPQGFDPIKVIELGKDPGLNTRAVHEMGYTGNGVKVALMDWQLPPSENYDSNIVSYRALDNARTIQEGMHGAAVASVLAGKETGVAPDAQVYYFAEREAMNKDSVNTDLIKSFKDVLEINKNLPENDKIRVISISGPIYGGEEAEALVKELNESGVWVMSSNEFWKNFGYLDKKDPMGNPDDFDNYQVHNPADSGRQLYVNSGDRTVAHYTETADYRHDSKASASWAIPVVAGYYALACEADPSMTPERFMQLAEDTAQVKQSVIKRGDSGNPQREYERHEGYIDCMYEFVKKDRPQITREEFMNLDDETWEKYSKKMFENLDIHAFEDAVPIFVQRGKQVLTERGEYDADGNVKDIPARYLPSTETADIKIIDIKALIEKIEAEKA